jgi:protein-L-isoaspartate(D-aspartate) O-methyltransferase
VVFAPPPWLVTIGEICYLLCYPLVPAAFLVVWIGGVPEDVDRFWSGVLASGFACYGSLPWLVSRPPRLVEGGTAAGASSSRLAKLNVAMLRRVSHQLNTFPSGHVAVAVSIAFAVLVVSPGAAWLFLALAVGIAFGAVAGRYHYVIDVMAGAIVGLIAGMLLFTIPVEQDVRPGPAEAGPYVQQRSLAPSPVEQDFNLARQRMVALIESRGVTDARVLEAMGRVPRERFVPPALASRAYDDGPLPIGNGQTISQPYVVAYMSEVLRVERGHRVLEIGTGSGYQAAILGELAREVYTIEIVPGLAARATETLRTLGYRNVQVRAGDGYAGWPDRAPFDRVIITAAPEMIPAPLLDQLVVGGLLVAPVGGQGRVQWLTVAQKTSQGVVQRRMIPVQFVPFTRAPP